MTDGGSPFCEVCESSFKIDKNKTIFPIIYINFTRSKTIKQNKDNNENKEMSVGVRDAFCSPVHCAGSEPEKV